MGARALEFAILTAGRSGEVLGARWAEIDMAASVWTVPADRMKAGKEHRVPLTGPALTLLARLHEVRLSTSFAAYVFASAAPYRPMSNMVMSMVLRRMDRAELTVHGFRSTFRDWAAEETTAPREVAEAALAHTLADKVEAAYRGSDLFEKRVSLMSRWAAFCGAT